jgi:glycosyltransferase involved in cell wall biosynthesis
VKIGIFLGDYDPTHGGGFTFQGDILRSLSKLAATSGHSFCILTATPDKFVNNPLVGELEIVPYSSPGIIEQLLFRVGEEFSSLRRRFARRSSFERAARQAGVKFLWFISHRYLPVDIPYMTIVWDLQHRLQPWFPEVSELGEWTSREKPYAWHLRRAAVVIAGTQAGQAEIERFYQIPAENIKILPHPTPSFALGVPTSDSAAVLEKYLLPADYLFYPAQFWAHKNHANLLYAAQILRDQHDLVFPLVFTGADHGNRPYIEKLITELRLNDQVHFLGFVPREDLNDLYRNAFALTYMTLFGPENLPPLEAFAFGCPVVASRVSGAEEQLGEAAILVNPIDPQDIAAGLLRLHADPQLRKTLVERGHERATRWTPDDFVRGAFEIFDGFESMRRTWGQ